ncbi:hypothetical protein [Massilia horti]|uniref:Uncharacterized protein n=1 Tax=Massilia horti TaxID=2562153 RepID=A0A4Y9SVR5_9BURK|nr:hypothetical protein [Massilia horti]TFW30885.1 hypothetical protein E4O92_15405 [Massilia horti]
MSGKKQRPLSVNRGRAKPKAVPVSEDSLQTRAPGWVAPSGSEQTEVPLGQQGQVQTEGAEPGTQQTGWSSRQQAQRMQARGEEDRLGEPRQSGYGGAEQYQHAGSQESPTGPPGSQQSGPRHQPQKNPDEPPADVGSRPGHKGPSRR